MNSAVMRANKTVVTRRQLRDKAKQSEKWYPWGMHKIAVSAAHGLARDAASGHHGQRAQSVMINVLGLALARICYFPSPMSQGGIHVPILFISLSRSFEFDYQYAYATYSMHHQGQHMVVCSASFLAEIPLRSPRKLFIFII